MAAIVHLNNAPIVEAILAIKIQPTPIVELPDLQKFFDSIHTNFPNIENLLSQELLLEVKESGPELTKSHQTVGFKSSSSDGKYVTQATTTDLVLSRLFPYVSGDDLIRQYETIWIEYIKLFKSLKIIRIGLRYINRFDLPTQNLNDYLTIRPMLAQDHSKPLAFGAIDNKYTVFSPKFSCHANIMFNFIAIQNTSTIVLDIDAFEQSDRQFNSFAEIAATIDRLRGLKNSVFFDNITEKGVDLFK